MEKPLWGNKTMRALLDLDVHLQSVEDMVKINSCVENIARKVAAGTATASDVEVLRMFEEHSDKLLRLVQATLKYCRPL